MRISTERESEESAVASLDDTTTVADYFAKGRAKGKAEGARTALLAVITSRGLPLHDDDGARIAACSDAATLEAWVGRAARATAVAEIFGD